jgi:peptidoglycan/xylan/chitin deacetylase (PgdA/CDA1 family)
MSNQLLRRLRSAVRIRSARAFPANPGRISLDAPIATISFDDFARNAWTTGGEIVESAGAKATYYTSGGFCGQTIDGLDYFTEDDLAEMQSRGHEAGCHTFAHASLPEIGAREILSDIARNAAFIRNATGQTAIRSFAYPFGAASIRTKLLLRGRFCSSRGIEPGINARWADFAQLKAVCLQPHFLRKYPVARLVDEVCARKGWLIFVAHDVSSRPTPYGCTPQTLLHAMETAQKAGVEFLTMEGAFDKIATRVA